MKLFTIGFTKKTAEEFFTALSAAGVRRIIDVRLNNSSQLAGFAKQNDLHYFLKTICDIEYIHRPDFAPTQEILDAYRKSKGSWKVFERDFMVLTRQRRIEVHISCDLLDHACLLCSEPTPEQCHRRLIAEYLKQKIRSIEICHL